MKTGFPYIPIVAKNIKKNMLLELMDKIFSRLSLSKNVFSNFGVSFYFGSPA